MYKSINAESIRQDKKSDIITMPTIIFDKSAAEFSADYHPECPARLIVTEAYLAKKPS